MQVVVGGVVMSHSKSTCCLDWVFAILNEVGFLEPTFQHCVVGHGEGTINVQESSRNDVHPWCNDCCKLLKEIV
jgi:hypothetical protein